MVTKIFSSLIDACFLNFCGQLHILCDKYSWCTYARDVQYIYWLEFTLNLEILCYEFENHIIWLLFCLHSFSKLAREVTDQIILYSRDAVQPEWLADLPTKKNYMCFGIYMCGIFLCHCTIKCILWKLSNFKLALALLCHFLDVAYSRNNMIWLNRKQWCHSNSRCHLSSFLDLPQQSRLCSAYFWL